MTNINQFKGVFMNIFEMQEHCDNAFNDMMSLNESHFGEQLSKEEIQAHKAIYQGMDPQEKLIALCYLTGISPVASPETAVEMYRGVIFQDPSDTDLWHLKNMGEADVPEGATYEFLKHVHDYGNPEKFFGHAILVADHFLFHSPFGILIFEDAPEQKSNDGNASNSSSEGGAA
jgi:hypothetical protein